MELINYDRYNTFDMACECFVMGSTVDAITTKDVMRVCKRNEGIMTECLNHFTQCLKECKNKEKFGYMDLDLKELLQEICLAISETLLEERKQA